MGSLRGWIRRAERAAKEASGTITLLDEESGETFVVPRDAFAYVIASYADEEPDPQIAPLLDRLDRLVYRDTGERFWLEDMTHTGKAAANRVGGED